MLGRRAFSVQSHTEHQMVLELSVAVTPVTFSIKIPHHGTCDHPASIRGVYVRQQLVGVTSGCWVSAQPHMFKFIFIASYGFSHVCM